jgi:DNA ligase-1
MQLPMLYKADSSGSIRQWLIKTEGNKIIVEHGQDGGKIQRTEDTVKAGKNVGKANATTPEQQAEAEAQSKWEKQKTKKGYVEDKTRAASEENDLQGEECMLAHEYGTLLNGVFTAESNHKIKFPAAVQPKLDGHRCRTKTDWTLWSRGHKPINSVPHIVAELKSIFPEQVPRLDGELYNHELKEDFEKISSIVRQSKKVDPEHELVQYHVYDVEEDGFKFGQRSGFLAEALKSAKFIKVVPTKIVNNHEEVLEAFREFIRLGYEGAIIRNLDSFYEGKRSYNLQKLKEFYEQEFEIVGIQEGRGKLQGCVGAFKCKTCDGVEFDVKMEGKTEFLKEAFNNESIWKGKSMTVRFKRWTKYAVPMHPVGVRIREDI